MSQTAADFRVGDAGIDIEMLVEGIIDQERIAARCRRRRQSVDRATALVPLNRYAAELSWETGSKRL